ncbi:MAG: amidohydrolase family protein [Bacteroidota bacterium]
MNACKLLLLILLSCLVLGNGQIQEEVPISIKSKRLKLIHGNWFNGTSFDKRTAWVKNGHLSFGEHSGPYDTLIDLKDKYVIPPFGEAHNHNLESAYQLQERIDSYLNNGVYYVKLLSTIKKRIDPLMHNYNKSNGVDVSMAHAPLTGSGGHPIGIRKLYLERGYFRKLFNTIEEVESHGYFIIDDLNQLNAKWEQVLSTSPDFVKLMLLYSEEYEKRKDDTTFFGHKGMDPALVPEVVNRAHDNNLRVSAHVNTAHDFHVAVEAGVDEIAHLPEIRNGQPISRADARLAKQKGITVVTTISLLKKNKDSPAYETLLGNIRSNLNILHEEGVRLAVGSDMYNDNSVEEFQFLHSLQLFTELELLKMWCENSALTTFPERKIAYLKEGYEANFLVLNKNPLEDIAEINKSIELKVKDGEILN